MTRLDIVIPVKNEAAHLKQLLQRIHDSMLKTEIDYKVLIVVDKSTDNTLELAQSLQDQYPLIVLEKAGKPGKGYSLIEGFNKSQAEFLAFIDADLQYPPEKLPEMLTKLQSGNYGVIIANRVSYAGSKSRSLGSLLNKVIIGKLLLKLNVDIQSGLKVFRKEIFEHLNTETISPWTFDIPLLHTAKELGYDLEQVDIDFNLREKGTSKVKYLHTAWEIIKNALKIYFKDSHIYHHKVEAHMKGPHISYRGKRYSTHSNLHHSKSGINTFTRVQNAFILFMAVLTITCLIIWPLNTGITIIAILSTIYFLDVVFTLYLTLKSLHFPPEIEITPEQIASVDFNTLPMYTILCPLYNEANVIGQFVENVKKINWPKDKLDVMLLLEENDKSTISAAEALDMPPYARVVIVPHSMPKTKPKACNYGLLQAKGEYIVIYDAEDKPDPQQLIKAYIGFQTSSPNTVCIQAKLNYYNTHQNLLTKLFTAEYSLWFDVVLPGLQSIDTIIPLGGTSNHFITKKLADLGGWDAFNVTEDCDLGVRLFSEGYKTAIINSTTYEEANSNLKNWIRQRSRWLKGYLQTYLVHMREPIKFAKKHKFHTILFQLIIGLRISFILINPILWITTISYFVFYDYVGLAIEALYPTFVFYMAAVALIFGNFLYLYNYMIGLAKKEKWEVLKYVFLVPLYWAVMSISAVMAFYQLFTKPHYWEKTHHGLDKKKQKKDEEKNNKVEKKTKPINTIKSNSLKDVFPTKTGIKIPPFFLKNKERIVQLINTIQKEGMYLVAAGLAANVIAYLYTAYLSRKINLEEFGLITLVGGILFVISIPLDSLSRTIIHVSAKYFGKYNEPANIFWKNIRTQSGLIGLVAMLLWLLLTPFLSTFFNIDSYIPFIIFAPVWLITSLSTVDSAYLNGNLKFKAIAIATVAEALVKYFATVVLVQSGYTSWMYVVFPLSSLISLGIVYYFAKSLRPNAPIAPEVEKITFPKDIFTSSLFMKFSLVAYLSFDVMFAKHFLSPDSAGEYALVAIAGKMIFFISNLFSQFINPIVSKNIGLEKRSFSDFKKLLLISTLSSLSVYLVIGIFGHITAPILLGEKALSIVKYLPIYGLGMLCFSIATNICSYQQLNKNFITTTVNFTLAIVQIVLMAIWPLDIAQLVNIMAAIGIVNLLVIAITFYYSDEILALKDNFPVLLDLFSKNTTKDKTMPQYLNILFLNWYDTKHVWGGGAEIYMHNIAKRLVKMGHHVTVFCGNDTKCLDNEVIDGVKIIRRGGLYTVAAWAFLYYIFKFRNKYDIIVDVAKGVPFFAPLYANVPVIGLIHHVHQEMFRTGLKFPLKHISLWLENTLLPIVYRNVQMLTVSESTKKEMLEIGLGKKREILIVHNGAEVITSTAKKTANPSLIYIGRLRFYKRIDVLINAVSSLIKKYPKLKLTIAGAGESEEDLKTLVNNLSLNKNVVFTGKVTEKMKGKLLTQSWVAVQPSIIEGWGITNIEANLCGTPVIASDVEGLRESVLHEKTGILVEKCNPEVLASKIEYLIENPQVREALTLNGYDWAKKFTWDKSAISFIDVLHDVYIAKATLKKHAVVKVKGDYQYDEF